MKKIFVLFILFTLIFTFNNIIYADIEVGSVPQDANDFLKKEVEEVTVENWVTNLNIPWQLVFLPGSNRALVTERSGNIRLIENGILKEEPYAVPAVAAEGEGGLMGIAHHPNFPTEPYIYIMYTYRDEQNNLYNRVARLTDEYNIGNNEEIILDEIPGGTVHNGGRIAFGPDDKLYVTTGDTWNRSIAQSRDNLGGKILRLNPDGSIPTDNPFEDSFVYSLGHRNPQGLAWHPETGHLFISDHGPSGEEGLQGKDRIKVIEPGGNYGWPNSIGYIEDNEYNNPLIMWQQATPPSGIAFYNNDLYIATLGSEALIKVELTHQSDYNYEVDRIERWFAQGNYSGVYGRFREVLKGPEGDLYLLTSNRDGRGNPRKEDDRILKLEIDH
ncbi:MAG: PQQ-dependent sugar dehydrogenase [Halanaerobiales bacterium]